MRSAAALNNTIRWSWSVTTIASIAESIKLASSLSKSGDCRPGERARMRRHIIAPDKSAKIKTNTGVITPLPSTT
jgi:hypothetical protein